MGRNRRRTERLISPKASQLSGLIFDFCPSIWSLVISLSPAWREISPRTPPQVLTRLPLDFLLRHERLTFSSGWESAKSQSQSVQYGVEVCLHSCKHVDMIKTCVGSEAGRRSPLAPLALCADVEQNICMQHAASFWFLFSFFLGMLTCRGFPGGSARVGRGWLALFSPGG